MDFNEIAKPRGLTAGGDASGAKPRILIGTGTCGTAAGADDILETLHEELAKSELEADIVQVGCIGLCYAEPLIEIVKPGRPSVFYGNLTPELMSETLPGLSGRGRSPPRSRPGHAGRRCHPDIPGFADLPVLKPQVRIALRNCGNIDPADIDHYLAEGGYSGLAKALKMTPQEVIDEIKKSGLRGRGGGGFLHRSEVAVLPRRSRYSEVHHLQRRRG